MKCPVCSSDNHQLRHKIKTYDYLICRDCGITFLSPFPSIEDVKGWYMDQTYFTQESGNSGYMDYLALQKGLKRTFMKRNKFLGGQPWWSSKKVLEIGCALGFYPEVLQDVKGLEYTGIDLNGYAVDVCRQKGLKSIQGDINVIPKKEHYDLIVFFDVIEHVIDPIEFLKDIHARLNVGGKIFLTTPSTSSLLSGLTGPKWVSYIVPHHVLLYQPLTMRRILKTSGFENIKIFSDFQWVPLSFLNDRLSTLFHFLQPMTKKFKDLEKKGKEFLVPVLNGNMLVQASKRSE